MIIEAQERARVLERYRVSQAPDLELHEARMELQRLVGMHGSAVADHHPCAKAIDMFVARSGPVAAVMPLQTDELLASYQVSRDRALVEFMEALRQRQR